MKIHKKVISENQTNYYFTKSRNHCLLVQYDKTEDFGRHSTSSTDFKICIHYNNSWRKTDFVEIKENELPQAIIDVLNYLKK